MSQGNQPQWQDEHSPNGQREITEHSIVLVIEPHAIWRHFLKAILAPFSFQVVTAATMQEAEALKAKIAPDDFDLVISDIHLSGDRQAQGGMRLFERWTATAATLPFVFLSDNAHDANLPPIRDGRASFIAKPVIRRDVLEIVAVRMLNAYPTNRSI